MLVFMVLFLDHPDLLLPAMLEEFPFLHVSPQTAHSMWQKQTRHLSSALKSGTEARRTKTQRMIEEAERRQEALVGILKKDLEHNLRMVSFYCVLYTYHCAVSLNERNLTRMLRKYQNRNQNQNLFALLPF